MLHGLSSLRRRKGLTRPLRFGSSTGNSNRSTSSPSSRAAGALVARPFGRLLIGAAFAALNLPSLLHAETNAFDIKRLSIEELMEIDVYSAARRLEPVQGVPSAIYVLTNEDIRRSRVTSVPEALRLVPGVDVARVDANKWAVSIRGFNTRTANKLLVLIDGRSIYDPLFAGTLWEARDVMLEDVDRIEVIRGPGGTLWGANAVNGIINIITKHARDTEGGLVSAGAGSEERGFGAARYGWRVGENQYARVYAKSFSRGTGFSPAGDAADDSHMSQTGFRWDNDANARDSLRVSGDVFSTVAGQRDTATITEDIDHSGGNVLADWRRRLSDKESMRLQFYYDRVVFDSLQFGEKRDTYDAEFQHSLSVASDHAIVWGLGYRSTRDDIRVAPGPATVDPAQRTDPTASAFIQDTVALTPDKLSLTVGTKLENNNYTGNEWEPNVRFAWTPDAQQTYWTAVSRAVRVPSRLETDIVAGGVRLGANVRSETVYAYEIGMRQLAAVNLWYDVATFYNVYQHLLTSEPTGQFSNQMHGPTYGAELAVRWQARPGWRLDAAYTYLQMNLKTDGSSIGGLQGSADGTNPHHELALRSAVDIARRLEFDATLRFVDELRALNVPAYTTLDLGLGWFPRRDLEVALVGQNLLDSHHPEQAIFSATGAATGTEVQRGVYTKITWRF